MRRPVPAVFLFLAAALACAPATARERDEPAAIGVRVDLRVELLSILFRLAGNPEYGPTATRGC